MKKFIVKFVELLGMAFGGLLILLLSPILLLFSILDLVARAWRRYELWAYCDGDELNRDKDRWRYS